MYQQLNGTDEFVGVWDVPQVLKCRSIVEGNALQDPSLPGFVTIRGDGDRELGLSWGFSDTVPNQPIDHP